MRAWFSEFAHRHDLADLELQAQVDKQYFFSNLEIIYQQVFEQPIHKVIVSSQKHFKNKILREPKLVNKGVHVFRYVFAKYAHTHNADKQFVENGKKIIHNYLDAETFAEVKQHVETFPIKESRSDINTISAQSGSVKKFITNPDFIKLISMCAGVSTDVGNQLINREAFVQRLHNKNEDGDIQKNIHLDTFFPAVKFFYFTDKVNAEHGPFRLQTNNNITESYIQWLYHQSQLLVDDTWDKSRGKPHFEGSFRIKENELKQLGITVDNITVPANTLIIANVGLFHARGEANSSHVRNSIHGGCRTDNPFEIL